MKKCYLMYFGVVVLALVPLVSFSMAFSAPCPLSGKSVEKELSVPPSSEVGQLERNAERCYKKKPLERPIQQFSFIEGDEDHVLLHHYFSEPEKIPLLTRSIACCLVHSLRSYEKRGSGCDEHPYDELPEVFLHKLTHTKYRFLEGKCSHKLLYIEYPAQEKKTELVEKTEE